jgi:hypothetical protein
MSVEAAAPAGHAYGTPHAGAGAGAGRRRYDGGSA